MKWRLGPIGFAYSEWNGPFYPPGCPPEKRLRVVARHFDLVEIDTSFYAVPSLAAARRWVTEVPADFLFILKAPRAITHEEPSFLTKDALLTWRNFEDVLEALGRDRTYVLLQLPPTLARTRQAELLEFLDRMGEWQTRVAVEFRHPSWYEGPPLQLPIPVVSADLAPTGEAGRVPGPGDYQPFPVQLSGTFSYLRLNGVHGQYDQDFPEICDSSARLRWWLSQLEGLADERLCLVTAGNSFAGHSPATLARLRVLLGLPATAHIQPSLF